MHKIFSLRLKWHTPKAKSGGKFFDSVIDTVIGNSPNLELRNGGEKAI